jgi:hypothetical protein
VFMYAYYAEELFGLLYRVRYRAIAQEVIHGFLTTEARAQSPCNPCENHNEQSGIRVRFSTSRVKAPYFG